MLSRQIKSFYLFVALLWVVAVDQAWAFLPAQQLGSTGPSRTARLEPLRAGGKFNKDPTAASRISELIKSFQQKQRELSEHPNRYMEDGMDAIKRHDPVRALESFDKALSIDNQTLVWHRGAMLYYVGRYDDAIRHLENTAAQFEDKFEQPATEERVWKIASMMRLHGREKAVSMVSEPKYGGEKRFLMGLVFELFRGRVSPEQLAAVIEEYKTNEYVNYDLYGHFYLGLYYDALGYAEECVRHMGLATQAAKAKSTDLMYHFPRMHLVLKEKKWQA